MGFEQVLDQYHKAKLKQQSRRERQSRDFFTKAEQAAIKFYSSAMESIERPAREGEKIFVGEKHAENPDMRGQSLEKLPANSGDSVGGTPA